MSGVNIVIPKASLHKELMLPIDGLPHALQQVVTTVADVFQCPRDFVLSAAFMALSTIIGKRVHSFDGKYYNYTSLWLVNVADSGSNKSEPVKWMFAPLNKREHSNYQQYVNDLTAFNKMSDSEKGSKPLFKQLVLSDSTPEGRNRCLFENPNGIMLYRDELKGFLDDIGRYTKSGEISQLLSIFDNNSFSINRKNDEPILINDPFMNIYGSIQPDILKSAFGSPLLMGNGFNQRWLFCYPERMPMPMYSKEVIPDSCSHQWYSFLSGIEEYVSYFNVSATIYLDNEAKELYENYYNTLQIKKATVNSYISAIYSKLQIQVQRWATLTSLFNYRTSNLEVQKEHLEYAVECMDYFEQCALKVYAQLDSEERGNQLSNSQLINKIHQVYGIKNQKQFAESIGISQQSISKFLKN